MNTDTPNSVVLETNLSSQKLLARGKVRDIYDVGDYLLIVATDRISAFDCILPTGIPDKGAVLTSMSRFWFQQMHDIVPNHLEDADKYLIPFALEKEWSALSRRSTMVKKAKPFPIECVARGYLSGSAWKEYRQNVEANTLKDGAVPCAGVLLPTGLVESARLPQPVFTPATKAASGHDMNISFEEAAGMVGQEAAERLRDYTLQIYEKAVGYAAERGIIIADTKLEFGLLDDQIILIDEVLTPDSSRFWDAASYEPGRAQPSYDKQYVRDYLETLSWDKTPPAPPLPREVVAGTRGKYREAHRRLVGWEL